MQNHRIPHATATWGIVKDASEPAPLLSVVANRNGKWTRIFALFERRILQKTHKNQNHKILYSTATRDSLEVASERAPSMFVKDNVQIQWITKIRIPQSRTRFAVLRDAAVSAKRNGKWI